MTFDPGAFARGWQRGGHLPPAQAKTPNVHPGQNPPPVTHPAPRPAPPPSMNQTQQSVYDLVAATLKDWGLQALAPDLKKLVLEGDTNSSTLQLALSQTQAWKQRFAGNEIRKANGLRELTPAEYLATEEQYQNVLRAYGLPPGFYDKPADFNKLIGNDVSAQELQSRVQIAHDEYMAAPEEVKNLWSQYFGKGDVLAGLLDPTRATQVIQDRGQQVAIGGEAAKNGFAVNQQRAQQLQQSGVTLAQATAAYQRIGQTFGTDQAIANRFGQQFGQTQEENDLLLGDGQSAQLRQSLYGQERGLFNGSTGVSASTLSPDLNY